MPSKSTSRTIAGDANWLGPAIHPGELPSCCVTSPIREPRSRQSCLCCLDGAGRLLRQLTGTLLARTLLPVLRMLAGIVAVAMLLTSGSALPQHVHAFAGHDHEEHRHGAAAHLHLAAAHAHHGGSETDRAPEIEACDPGTHAVSVTFVCASPQTRHALVAVVFDATTLVPPQTVRCSVAPTDVRVHGPPRSRRTPPRAPPVVHPA